MPQLPEKIEAALRDSIRRFGVLVPVVRDQHGRIIDGHNRVRIADELGQGYRVDDVVVPDDDAAAAMAWSLNADRWQLDPSQRREVAAQLRREGHSVRAIAGATGVDERTVRRDLDQPAAHAAGGASKRVTGRDGKSYPAGRRIITPEEKAEIIARVAAGEKQKDVAASLELAPNTVSKIVSVARDAAGAPRISRPAKGGDTTTRQLRKIQDAVAAWRDADDEGWLTIPEAARRTRVLDELIPFLEERRAVYAKHGRKLLGGDR